MTSPYGKPRAFIRTDDDKVGEASWPLLSDKCIEENAITEEDERILLQEEEREHRHYLSLR